MDAMLSDLKIEKKLMAAFAVVILAIVAMGAVVFLQINALEGARLDRVRASAVQREAETADLPLARQDASCRGFLVARHAHARDGQGAHRRAPRRSLDP